MEKEKEEEGDLEVWGGEDAEDVHDELLEDLLGAGAVAEGDEPVQDDQLEKGRVVWRREKKGLPTLTLLSLSLTMRSM